MKIIIILILILAFSLTACSEAIYDDCNETEYCVLIKNTHKYYAQIDNEKKSTYLSRYFNSYLIWKTLIEVNPCIHRTLSKSDFFTDTKKLRNISKLKNAKIEYFYNENNYLDKIYIDLNSNIDKESYHLIKDILFILNDHNPIDEKKLESFLQSIQFGQPDEDDQSFISNKISFDQINIAGFQIVGTKEIRLIIYKTK